MLTDEFLDLASAQGKAEFGLQTIHADEGQAVDRRNNIPKARAKFEQVNKRGLPYEVSIIYGSRSKPLPVSSKQLLGALNCKSPC